MNIYEYARDYFMKTTWMMIRNTEVTPQYSANHTPYFVYEIVAAIWICCVCFHNIW